MRRTVATRRGRGRRGAVCAGAGGALRPRRGHGVLRPRVGRRAAGLVDLGARGLQLPATPPLGRGQHVGARHVALRLNRVRAQDGAYRPLRLRADLAGAPLEPLPCPQGLRLDVLGRHVGGVR